MKKRNRGFDEIEILQEKQLARIREQEAIIRTSFQELSDNLTGAALINKVKDNLFTGSGFAFKLGFMAITLLRKKLAERKRGK